MCAAKKTKITITLEDLITFAKRWNLKFDGHAFWGQCTRCYGNGNFAHYGVCFLCRGSRVSQRSMRHIRQQIKDAKILDAERERNGGKTDAELAREAYEAELQVQRDRNGGLTDAELEARRAEDARVQAEAEAAIAEKARVDAVAARFPVGERMEFSGVIDFQTTGYGHYGPWTLTKIKLDCGTDAVYFNALGEAGKGDAVKFKATVKDVSARNGVPQVVLQRAKLAAK